MGTCFYYERVEYFTEPLDLLATLFEEKLHISDSRKPRSSAMSIPNPFAVDYSDREMSPKLIVGTKKYGRRSRPTDSDDDNNVEDVEDEDQELVEANKCSHEDHRYCPVNLDGQVQCTPHRSSSQNDQRRERSPSAKRCSSLPVEVQQQHSSNSPSPPPPAAPTSLSPQPPKRMPRAPVSRRVGTQAWQQRSAKQAAQDASKTLKQLSSSLESLGYERPLSALRAIWMEFTRNIGASYLSEVQLGHLFEHMGIPGPLAARVVSECFWQIRSIVHYCNHNHQHSSLIARQELLNLVVSARENDLVLYRCECACCNRFRNGFCDGRHAPARSLELPFYNDFYGLDLTKLSDVAAENAKGEVNVENLPTDSILQLWDRAGITNGRNILQTLGFEDEDINLTQLNKVLAEEIRSVDCQSRVTLLRAFSALQSAELASLRQLFRQLYEENTKLRADNTSSNRRAVLLAMEVDERHATLEASKAKELLELEERSNAVIRDLTTRLNNERESHQQSVSHYEMKQKLLEQSEIKLKTEVELTRKENRIIEESVGAMERRLRDLLEENLKMSREALELREQKQFLETKLSDSLGADREAEFLAVMEKCSRYQRENTSLRDKNDELVVEVENLNFEFTRAKTKLKRLQSSASGDGEEKNCDDFAGQTEVRAADASTETSDVSGDWLPLNSELQGVLKAAATKERAEFAVQTETPPPHVNSAECQTEEDREEARQLQTLEDTVATMAVELETVRKSEAEAKERCQQFENSLEDMRRLFEDCEDYWQAKVETERRNLEDEKAKWEEERRILEEEHRANGENVAELMAKVSEYDEQFKRSSRLPTIDENEILENSYMAMQTDYLNLLAESRLQADKVLELEYEISDLKIRLGESVEILTGANELNHETAGTAAALGGQGAIGQSEQSAASSPISYLWHQSTIHEPALNCQQPPEAPEDWDQAERTTSTGYSAQGNHPKFRVGYHLVHKPTSRPSRIPRCMRVVEQTSTNSEDDTSEDYENLFTPRPYRSPRLAGK